VNRRHVATFVALPLLCLGLFSQQAAAQPATSVPAITTGATVTSIASASASASAAGAGSAPAPQFEHVIVVVLENTNAAVVAAKLGQLPFLASLGPEGVQLDAMFGVDHASLPNYIAMISGQASTRTTRADCFIFRCVYKPGNDANVADQLEAKGLTWKAYADGMTEPCQHSREGRIEQYRTGYATRHNPFLYFANIVRDTPRCQAHDVSIAQLAIDRDAGRLPNLSFIIPDTCHDGHDCPLTTADSWLHDTIGPLLDPPELWKNSLFVVTFDEADSSQTEGCCGNARGGHIATWLLGGQLAAGTHSPVQYSHYSLLRSIENNFGLPCLNHACDALTNAYGSDIYGVTPTSVTVTTGLPAKRSRLVPLLAGSAVLTGAAALVVVVGRRRSHRPHRNGE
jgi:phosphatidylinositol-3-phosphatase